ncbi:MAG: hypothetical protein Q9226_000819 [Calogaya cf. arnoldii]
MTDAALSRSVWRGLEEVPAVTGLLLRRQTRRAWEPASLRAVIGQLTGLQELYYEPWREWEQVVQQDRDKDTQIIFKLPSFRQLKRLVLFEDFDDHHDAAFEDFPYYLHAEPVRTPDVAFSEALAEVSLKVEHLSASFNVEAKWFLQASQPSWVWEKLTSLVLTSDLFGPEGSHAVINNLLRAAAKAAKQMPALKSMELWNGGWRHGCVFQFQSSRGIRPAEILWRATYDLPLGISTIDDWKDVARQHDAQCDFRVSKELLDPKLFESHGDASQLLRLLQPVICPVSAWQIRKEIGDLSDLMHHLPDNDTESSQSSLSECGVDDTITPPLTISSDLGRSPNSPSNQL